MSNRYRVFIDGQHVRTFSDRDQALDFIVARGIAERGGWEILDNSDFL